MIMPILYNRDMTNTNTRGNEMITEQVKIVVHTSTNKVAKVVTVESDGSFYMVDGLVNRLINRDFPIGTVIWSGWNYI